MSIHGEVAIELRILTLEKLPHRCPDPDDASKEMSLSPVVGIYRSVLVDGMITHICLEECRCDNHEKIHLYLGVCIDRRDECMMRIKLYYLLILSDCIGDISSLHSALSLYI